MATADEILAAAVEAEADKTLVIDNDLRKIIIPPSVKHLGVESDDGVLRLDFRMPRMYGVIDLSTFKIRVNYMNANGEGDAAVAQNVAISDEFITFSWKIERHAAAYKGNVHFIVCLKNMDLSSVITEEFNTTVSTLPVLEGLETTERVAQQNPDILENILARLESLETNGTSTGGSCNIPRIETAVNGKPKINLRDLESGTYIIYGYFEPYPNSNISISSDNSMVSVIKKDAGTHAICLDPLNAKIVFFEILVDDTTEKGYTYTRTIIPLLDVYNVLGNGGGACNVPRYESAEETEAGIRNLRELDSGTYILDGYWNAYPGADTYMPFDNRLVTVEKQTEGSHLFVYETLNAKVIFHEILVDAAAADGFTHTRTEIDLLDMHNTALNAQEIKLSQYDLLDGRRVTRIEVIKRSESEVEEQIGEVTDGKTPVKGVDYFTPAEIQDIAEQAAAMVEVPDSSQSVDLSSYARKTPEIVGTAVAEKAIAFSNLMHGTDEIESFTFFTDPHFLNATNNETQMREYLDTLNLHHDVTPTSFVIGGGDWYGNSDSYESACFKLGYIDGWMRRLFGNRYYPAVGNHDTNQQGQDETGGAWTGLLPRETVRNLWFREHGSNYYAFDGSNTKFYVLDTWKEGGDTEYYWEQIAWLGERLKTDNPQNSALVLHIGYYPSGESYVVDTLASNALALSEAFNNATAITLNGVTYDFTGCTGTVRFALSGHIHADYATIVNGIPLIATTHMRDGDTPTFDLCLADYGANKLHLVRVGTGEDRQFRMGPDGAILDGTEEDSGVSLILGMNLTGRNFQNNVKFRSIYVGTEQPEGITVAIPWSSASTGDYPYPVPYYPIEIPEGVTKVSVTCPDYVKWAVVSWSKSGWNTDGSKTEDSGWLSVGGGTYELAEESEVLMILFNDNNGTDMTADTYDSSSFSLAFE